MIRFTTSRMPPCISNSQSYLLIKLKTKFQQCETNQKSVLEISLKLREFFPSSMYQSKKTGFRISFKILMDILVLKKHENLSFKT